MAETVVAEELWLRLTEALGLPETADAETAVATVEDMVTTPVGDTEKVAAAAAAAGLTAVDAATLTQLKADAEQGRVLAAAARKRDVAELVDATVRRGAIAPSRRKHWIEMVDADPEMGKVLASMPDELAAPLTEIGHSIDITAARSDDVLEQADWFH